MYMFSYMHFYIHAYFHISISACIQTYTYTHLHIYMWMYTGIDIYKDIHIYICVVYCCGLNVHIDCGYIHV